MPGVERVPPGTAQRIFVMTVPSIFAVVKLPVQPVSLQRRPLNGCLRSPGGSGETKNRPRPCVAPDAPDTLNAVKRRTRAVSADDRLYRPRCCQHCPASNKYPNAHLVVFFQARLNLLRWWWMGLGRSVLCALHMPHVAKVGAAAGWRLQAENNSGRRKPPAQIPDDLFRVIHPLAVAGRIGHLQARHFGLSALTRQRVAVGARRLGVNALDVE